ncbi:MAG: pyruvate kinase alpha/beta domain-containing protein [Armatimonadota bacterium]|jgi:hypothetical protein
MPERRAVWFDEPSETHTRATLQACQERARELGISQIVVATTSGQTALEAAKAFGDDATVVGVTLHAGTWAKYAPPDPEIVAEAEKHGVKFLTATHALMGHIGNALRDKFGGVTHTELIAFVLYMFSQGTKVAVEVVAMAADAGLLDVGSDVIGIGGTGGGADTAIVMKPAYTTNFFDLKVREIICMPRT